MKAFKCGKCNCPHQIDDSLIQKTVVLVSCVECGASNTLRFGPVVIIQSKSGVQKFNLKIGVNKLGRKTNGAKLDLGIEDNYVSRNHAEILLEKKDNKYFIFIKDVGSANGTFSRGKNKLKSNLAYAFTKNDYFIVGLTKVSLQRV
jgi:hypothetical protein